MHKEPGIPKWSEWLLKRLTPFSAEEGFKGDIVEEYEERLRLEGRSNANRWIHMHALKAIPKALHSWLVSGGSMFCNYLKTAYRNIERYRGYSFVNIIGLAVGMACSIFIFVFVKHELSYDRFHHDADRIYQVLSHLDIKNLSISPTPLGPALEHDIPEVIVSSRFHWIWGGAMVSYGDRTFNEDRLRFSDPSFFRMFHFQFIKGLPEHVFDNPYSIVLTQKSAEKYFGDEDPIGKVLTLNHQHPLTVTGIIASVPENSTIQFDMLVPIEFNVQNLVDYQSYTAWDNLTVYTFLQLRDVEEEKSVEKKINQLVKDHSSREECSFSLLPLTQRYFFFYSNEANMYAYITIAVFILLIACFNFINLSTARSNRRMKEIGMRKIVGARRSQIIRQFLGESILISFIAGLFAIVIFGALFSVLESIIGKSLIMKTPFLILCCSVVILFTGLVSGSYPALVISKVGLIQSLKGRPVTGSLGYRLRKSLVAGQFVISTMLLISMLVINEQRSFLLNMDVGYKKEFLIGIPMDGGSGKFYPMYKQSLLEDPGVLSVTGSASSFPFFNWTQGSMEWLGKDPDEEMSINYNMVDYDFVETMQLELIAGRGFSRKFSADLKQGYLINETMSNLIGSWRATT